MQGGAEGGGEQVQVLGGRAAEDHPVGTEHGEQRAEAGGQQLPVPLEGLSGAVITGAGGGRDGGGIGAGQRLERGPRSRLLPAPGQTAVAAHRRVRYGEVTGLGMGAVARPDQPSSGHQAHSDAGAERDDQAAAAATAGPVTVFADRRGRRVIVDDAGPPGPFFYI